MLAIQSCSTLICRRYSCCAHVGWTRVTQAWPVEATPAREQAIERKIEAPTEDSRAQTATNIPSKFASKSTKNRPKIAPKFTLRRLPAHPRRMLGVQATHSEWSPRGSRLHPLTICLMRQCCVEHDYDSYRLIFLAPSASKSRCILLAL